MSNKAIQGKRPIKLPPGYGLPPDFQWQKPSINFLISTVEDNFEDFYDKTLKKKVLWKKIAVIMNHEGYSCTAEECDKKWRNLKKTYVNVLQKQVLLDFSSKFIYFEKMHSFIGKEVDPLGMREQRLKKAIIEKNPSPNKRRFNQEYNELIHDGSFQWDDDAITILLNSILKSKDKFKIGSSISFSNSHIDSIWQDINMELGLRGYVTDNVMCQTKWCNLASGFRYHQAAAERSGIFPHWKFFGKVREVINTLNVPVTIGEEKQFTSSTSAMVAERGFLGEEQKHGIVASESIELTPNFEPILRQMETNDETSGISIGQFKSLMASINKLNKSIDVESYFNDLQKRLELHDRFVREFEEQKTQINDICQSLKRCNNILTQQQDDNFISKNLPQNSLINIDDLDPINFININSADDAENKVIIVDCDSEFILQCETNFSLESNSKL